MGAQNNLLDSNAITLFNNAYNQADFNIPITTSIIDEKVVYLGKIDFSIYTKINMESLFTMATAIAGTYIKLIIATAFDDVSIFSQSFSLMTSPETNPKYTLYSVQRIDNNGAYVSTTSAIPAKTTDLIVLQPELNLQAKASVSTVVDTTGSLGNDHAWLYYSGSSGTVGDPFTYSFRMTGYTNG